MMTEQEAVAYQRGGRNLCPECGAQITHRCRCTLGDMGCANGHDWHTCPVHKTLVMTKSDHANPQKCSCGKPGMVK